MFDDFDYRYGWVLRSPVVLVLVIWAFAALVIGVRACSGDVEDAEQLQHMEQVP